MVQRNAAAEGEMAVRSSRCNQEHFAKRAPRESVPTEHEVQLVIRAASYEPFRPRGLSPKKFLGVVLCRLVSSTASEYKIAARAMNTTVRQQ